MEQKKEFKSSGSKSGQGQKNQSKSGSKSSQSGSANFTSDKYASNLGG